jgi:hypothetical protein
MVVVSSVSAGAQERATDAALGALSGALVAGPVGLVAGGVIGFMAGPNIARGLGFKRRHAFRTRSASNRHDEGRHDDGRNDGH